MSERIPCECGFWDRDRHHSRVGGGICGTLERRRNRSTGGTEMTETKWILLIEYMRLGAEPEFIGPFASEKDAFDWLYRNPQSADTEIGCYPLEAGQ